MARDFIVYQFSRVKVERGDFRPFVGQFAFDKLPAGRRLRELMELVDFITRDLAPMNPICKRAEMFEDRVYQRSRAVFEYFGLPFDTPRRRPPQPP